MDGIELNDVAAMPREALEAEVTRLRKADEARETEALLPPAPEAAQKRPLKVSPPPVPRRKSAVSQLKSSLTRTSQRTRGRLAAAGLGPEAVELVASLKHPLRRLGLNIVDDALQCWQRAEICQYFQKYSTRRGVTPRRASRGSRNFSLAGRRRSSSCSAARRRGPC